MKMRSLLLLALVVSACNGTNPALPASPSALAEAPLLRQIRLRRQRQMITEMGADDFESPQDLASETTGELSVEAFFDSVLATEPDVAGTGLDVTGLDGSTTAAGSPGRPVIVSASAKGNSVTFSWKKGSNGGAPKAYIVVYKGLTKTVHLSTSFSFTATPGRYLGWACTARTTPAKVHSRPQRSPLAQAAVCTTGRSTGAAAIIAASLASSPAGGTTPTRARSN